jgi:hypothetical protein
MLSDDEIRKMSGKELEELGYRLRPAVKHNQEEQKDKANDN